MNESELKDIFVSSIESGHIIDSKGGNLPFTNPEAEIRIKSEGYFGQFDFVLAVLQRNNTKAYQSTEQIGTYYEILMRTGQLTEIAKTEKCRIDPV